MTFSIISNPNIFNNVVQNVILPGAKLSIFAFALQAIQNIGVLSEISKDTTKSFNDRTIQEEYSSSFFSRIIDFFHSSYTKDCFLESSCSDIKLRRVHPREQQAVEIIFKENNEINWTEAKEILRFRSDNPLKKVLFISAEHDHNEALDPSITSSLLVQLSRKFDLRYQVVDRHLDICKAVLSANATGELVHIVISGHGNPNLIAFDAEEVIINEKKQYRLIDGMPDTVDFNSCFSGLHPSGKITLLSCSTGKEQDERKFNNLAQKMADLAKRVVIAPTDLAYPAFFKILSSDTSNADIDDLVFYHPENRGFSFLPFYNTNLLQFFRPTFENCSPKINKHRLHDREIMAARVAKDALLKSSKIHKNDFLDETMFLQVCHDDPRDKLLFFSSKYDGNNFLQPQHNSNLFSFFVDSFDFRYKVFESLDEICETIKHAANLGRVKNVIIQSHGNPEKGLLIEDDRNGNRKWITLSNSFKECFAKVDVDGTVTFIGGLLAEGGENSFAQKVANIIQKRVTATICPVELKRITVKSANPLTLEHKAFSFIRKLIIECKDPKENYFVSFKPKKQSYYETIGITTGALLIGYMFLKYFRRA